jgi:hypothetical protein
MKPIMVGGAQITQLGEELSSPTGNGARLERQGVTLKILAAIGGIVGLAVAATFAPQSVAANPTARSANSHASGSSAPVAAASPMANIADLYAWTSGPNLNLVMDVSPLDSEGSAFDPSIIYVFHLTSKPGRYIPGATGGIETQVRCRFASNTSVECWAIAIDPVGGAVAETKDYVVGDPRNPVGVVSARGKLRVFAGRRSNPASFNQAGFASAVTAIKAVPAMPQPDPAGCPHPDAFDVGRALGVRSAMQNGSDAFAGTNVMAIVAQIDKALVNDGGNTLVAVWASTHAGS